MKSLFLMCGPAGSGKSTWIKAQMAEAKYPCRWVSRDNVRNTFLTDADKNMFAYEDLKGIVSTLKKSKENS